MLQYVDLIVLPYVRSVRHIKRDESLPAVVIMDNFKGQVTKDVLTLLDSNNIYVALMPPNTTDKLQPLDVSVNKPAKSFVKRKFEEWYAKEIFTQLRGPNPACQELEPVDLSLPIMKEFFSGWLVDMFNYIPENPQLIVNEFIRAGISRALDNIDNDDMMENADGKNQEVDEDCLDEDNYTSSDDSDKTDISSKDEVE